MNQCITRLGKRSTPRSRFAGNIPPSAVGRQITLAASESVLRRMPCCVRAAAACASSPLLQIPAWWTKSCAIAKAGAAKPGIRSSRHRARRPAHWRKFRNNSKPAADVQWSHRTPVRPECVQTPAQLPEARRKIRPGRDRTGANSHSSSRSSSPIPPRPDFCCSFSYILADSPRLILPLQNRNAYKVNMPFPKGCWEWQQALCFSSS